MVFFRMCTFETWKMKCILKILYVRVHYALVMVHVRCTTHLEVVLACRGLCNSCLALFNPYNPEGRYRNCGVLSLVFFPLSYAASKIYEYGLEIKYYRDHKII